MAGYGLGLASSKDSVSDWIDIRIDDIEFGVARVTGWDAKVHDL